MPLSILRNSEPFSACELICEHCAEEASSLTPDRRLYVSCRYAGDWCRKVEDEIKAGNILPETFMCCARACERCDELCRNSILACCRECAAICALTAEICHRLATAFITPLAA